MIRICLTDDEGGILQRYAATAPIGLMRAKAHAILMRSQGVKIKIISFTENRSYRTIERWLKEYQQKRLSSIFSGKKANENAAKLTRFQKKEIRQTLRQPPSKQGLPREFWDVPQLKDYVKAEFGIVYESVQSYHYLLKFSRLSFKYPDTFDIRRDEGKIAKRVKEIRKEVAPMLKDPEWEVFASDETGLYFEAVTRRAWLRKGERTVVKVNRSKEKQNYIGFLNLKTGRCSNYRIIKGKQEYIIGPMITHVKNYPNKKICIIWDNASFHKGYMIKDELKKGGELECVHLIALPAYAPDTNPIEHVWREGKDATANHQYHDFETTKKIFEDKISSQIFNYQI